VPVIKSAIKKLRKDRKREKENDARRRSLEWTIRQARKSPSKINAAYSAIDKAVKRNIIHKNKAARIKSSLAKLGKPKATVLKSASKIKSAASSKKKTSSPKK